MNEQSFSLSSTSRCDNIYTAYFNIVYIYTHTYRGTQWRSWLRHCATSREVAGSIPGDVVGIFH